MSWSHEIDRERRLVLTSGWDKLTGAEILEHRHQLENDPDFSSDFFQLVDLSSVTEVQIDFATMQELANRNLFSDESRRAFVATNPLAFGMSSMFISLRRVYGGVEQMEIFNNRDEALRWLFAGIRKAA